jgi:TonB family protein
MRARRRSARLAWTLLAVAAGLAWPDGWVRAQGGRGDVTGAVRDTSGVGIVGARVELMGTTLRAESDERGAFRIQRVPGGLTSILVRRLGFRPETTSVIVASGRNAPLEFTLHPVAYELDPVVVRSNEIETGPFAEFHRRRRHGPGRFITRAEIESRDPTRLTDMLRSVPGIRFVPARFDASAMRMRGAQCPPLVFVDGTMLGGEFDIDILHPSTVEGVEIYMGISTVPPQFRGPRGEGVCGAVVVWTRHGERRPARRKSDVDLAGMVAALEVYTADQVDIAARPDSSAPATAIYPESLLEAGTGGAAVVEFVVGADGRIELETIGVVSSTHPLLGAAARLALDDARFHPAWKDGRAVRQLVQLPFRFVPEQGDRKR